MTIRTESRNTRRAQGSRAKGKWTCLLVGLSLLTYGVNLFLFATGRLMVNAPPVLNKYAEVPYTDPLPQALVLTAIVISFGMTAVVVMIALGAYLSAKDDQIDMIENTERAGDDA